MLGSESNNDPSVYVFQGAGRIIVDIANYNWDDDGKYVRVRVQLPDAVLEEEDADTDITV